MISASVPIASCSLRASRARTCDGSHGLEVMKCASAYRLPSSPRRATIGSTDLRRPSKSRRDQTSTPHAERDLLFGYWLRASRARAWLAVAILTTLLLLMAFGLPQHSPKQEATGTFPAGGGPVTFTIDKDAPQNPTGQRFTSKRFEKAFNVTLNSVVFHSSGQDLTTGGTYIEMTPRLLEPAIPALAVLAIRGRIKRRRTEHTSREPGLPVGSGPPTPRRTPSSGRSEREVAVSSAVSTALATEVISVLSPLPTVSHNRPP